MKTVSCTMATCARLSMFLTLLLNLTFLGRCLFVADSRLPLNRRLFFGAGNGSITLGQVDRRGSVELSNNSPTTDKTDLKLKQGASLWQKSINSSLAHFSEIKTSGFAHSEPLKFDRSKEKVEEPNAIDYDDEEGGSLAGTSKAPPCATLTGRHYCLSTQNYPLEVVSKIVKYYKYPLENMFEVLRHQVMPQLASDSAGGLVCDSKTNLIRVGWAMNTNSRWLVVLNTEHYQQYVTEILCKHASGTCNFVPPCYQAKCLQRYNTQKLLVIDPAVPHKGPFLSEFIFPSCCVCHIKADKSYLVEEKKTRV